MPEMGIELGVGKERDADQLKRLELLRGPEGGMGRDYERRWAEQLPRLRHKGFAAELTGFAAPVQLEGTLDTGERFYFHVVTKVVNSR